MRIVRFPYDFYGLVSQHPQCKDLNTQCVILNVCKKLGLYIERNIFLVRVKSVVGFGDHIFRYSARLTTDYDRMFGTNLRI